MPHKIAYFISSHGYGHAARAAAIMTTLREIRPSIQFEIFTKTPSPFFAGSLGYGFGYHHLLTDIGLVQQNALVEDLTATIDKLDGFLPFAAPTVNSLAQHIKQLGCRLVCCDIAPLGIAVARAAAIPSVLIENFTWDWIYEGYLAADERLKQHIAYLRQIFAAADYHIQTQPVCDPQTVDLTSHPVSRKSRAPAARIRAQLEVPDSARLVLITMGGDNAWDYPLLDRLASFKDTYFLLANNGETYQRQNNWIILPRHSDFFHPDLVNASDALIGKVGYSTLAEAYQAGVPFGYLIRPKFRESPILKTYLETHLPGRAISEAQFRDGSWLNSLPDLLALPRAQQPKPNGADQIARFIDALLEKNSPQRMA